MFKHLLKPMVVALSLTSLPALANPVTPADTSRQAAGAAGAATSSNTANKQSFHMSCSAGDYTGEAKGYVQYYNNSTLRAAVVRQYKITKKNNVRGGNSANVNLKVDGQSSKSPDSMKQDGNWNSISLSRSTARRNAPMEIQFIFDKSGAPDPRCTTRKDI
ncbi:hypothetical protein [Pseudomonas sp. S1_E04]